MRWPWTRRRMPAAAELADRTAVAEVELAAARRRLAATRAQGAEVRQVARRLRELRERNQFGAMIEQAFRGGS